MIKYSIYTSCFDINKNNFNYWKTTIPKWIDFIDDGDKGEIIIAVNNDDDRTKETLETSFSNKIKIINTSFSYEDYTFDGKIKNAALQECKYEICLGLDLDEYPSPNKKSWDNVSLKLLNISKLDAVFIPSIDLCKNYNSYKSVGMKWYMHKQGLYRGIWENAKLDNGKIDIKKSDTCELLKIKNQLCSSAALLDQFDELSIDNIKKYDLPFVIHLGWLDWQNRKNQNQTWQPVWSNRAGYEVKDIMHEENQFNNIEVYPHNLDI